MSTRAGRSICVVGGGRWGANHIRTLDELGLLGGFVEPDLDRRGALAARHPRAAAFSRIEDAAQQPFDGFVIATPAHTHVELARFVIDRGRHVLVEKPLALVSRDAHDLVAAAARARVNLMVGHVLLFHPAIRKMREIIRGGQDSKIGRLQYLYSNRLNLGTVRTEENILWSFAPHDISIFQYWIGAAPIEVSSRGGVFLQPHIHDTTLTMLRYPDNVVGHVFLSWLHPYKEHRIVVIGSKGMLSFEDSSRPTGSSPVMGDRAREGTVRGGQGKQLLFYEKGIDWVQGEPIPRDGPTESIPYGDEQPLSAELGYFADHCDGRPVEIASGAHGVEVLEILERASESLRGASDTAPVRARAGQRGASVHESSYVDDGVVIGEGTKVWHFCHLQPGARIGKNCSLGQNVNIANGVVIGDGVKIQNNVSVYEGVELEDDVFVGPSAVFTNVRDPRSRFPRGREGYARTLVRRGATLGANATIVCGVTIGEHAFIAAGAVVTHDVPDHALVAGVPARRIGWSCECGERLPEPSPLAVCPRCRTSFAREGDGLAARRA
jgi:UDP-2-acetamido-3-amino-2,3-dideoxy-glucuronate N-acetyltransferase